MAAIDRDYWLDYAKNSVTGSVSSREKAGEKLDAFLLWVWGIYTSVFTLASLFNLLSNSITQLILVAQPILIIMIARFCCTLISMPSTADADPNVVAEIIEGHMEIVENKKQKLKWAILATAISIVSLCIALIGYNVLDPNRQLKSEIEQLKLNTTKVTQMQNPLQARIDSVRLLNSYYDLLIENELKAGKLNCVRSEDKHCVDSINAFH